MHEKPMLRLALMPVPTATSRRFPLNISIFEYYNRFHFIKLGISDYSFYFCKR